MTRSHMLLVIGLLVILAPFSGLPVSWLEFLLPIFGIMVAAIGYSFRPKRERPVTVSSEAPLVI